MSDDKPVFDYTCPKCAKILAYVKTTTDSIRTQWYCKNCGLTVEIE